MALTDGHISRFHVIGGCDGYEGERSYYTDLTKALPDTSVVLTVGCYKFRINHLHMGTIGGERSYYTDLTKACRRRRAKLLHGLDQGVAGHEC
ncbi:hypothetical protein DYB26_015571, partial [Aphanomyces astaci]